ncbi:hypothetical protein CBOM_05703 [Ceraceosorus bombacis]|uniref:Uncharacterized protein n=1 Tax=Ceraceosorus bombacis TaxID=401625 RepID=A0A0P1BRA5_9BASI|nr:hypothetical protein CBOM_05703 [Ceraceosorus bombacis]
MEKLRDDDGTSHGCYSATNPPQLVFRLPNGTALMYDSMILILTVAKVIHTSQIQGFSPNAFRQTRRSASPLSRQLYNSAIFFYILSIISYTGGLVWASFHSQNRSTSVFAGLQFLVSVTIAPRILRRLKLLDRSALGLEPAKEGAKPIRMSRRSPSQWSDADWNFQTSSAKPNPIQAPEQAVSPRIQSEVLVRSPSMGFRRELTEDHQQIPLQTLHRATS